MFLRGFLRNDEFGSRGDLPLRLQLQVVEAAVTAPTAQKCSEIAVNRLRDSWLSLGQVAVQYSLMVAKQHIRQFFIGIRRSQHLPFTAALGHAYVGFICNLLPPE